MPGVVTVTRAIDYLDPDRRFAPIEIITFTWVGDSADGTLPSTVVPNGKVYGTLLRLVTDPGTPAPTALYDISVTDEDGLDVLGAAGQNRSATVTEEAELKMTTFQRVVANTLTFVLTGQAVLSAQGVARIYILR